MQILHKKKKLVSFTNPRDYFRTSKFPWFQEKIFFIF
jgi:hypothetical protein